MFDYNISIAQLIMFHMERRSRNTMNIIIIIITCCHIEIVATDQTFYLTQSQYTDQPVLALTLKHRVSGNTVAVFWFVLFFVCLFFNP